MRIRWSPESRDDVDRLVDFVAAYDLQRADELEQDLQQTPRRLLEFARRGVRLSEFDPREVREFRVRNYVMRYELSGTDVVVLCFFHSREDRTGT